MLYPVTQHRSSWGIEGLFREVSEALKCKVEGGGQLKIDGQNK